MATAASELEKKIFVHRVVISWIDVYHSGIYLADHLIKVSGASTSAQVAQRHLDRAHARYCSAVNTSQQQCGASLFRLKQVTPDRWSDLVSEVDDVVRTMPLW